MTLTYSTGDILNSGIEALVNPINCLGIQGAGLAKAFSQRYPLVEEMIAFHKTSLEIGKVTMVCLPLYEKSSYVFLLPTKKHWKDPSQLEWITQGVEALRRELVNRRIKEVAIPALGCGLGGLSWSHIKPIIEDMASKIPSISCTVYPPQ